MLTTCGRSLFNHTPNILMLNVVFPECFRWNQWIIFLNYFKKIIQTCQGPRSNHSASKTQVAEMIFKLHPIHPSVIYQIPWMHWISYPFRENSDISVFQSYLLNLVKVKKRRGSILFLCLFIMQYFVCVSMGLTDWFIQILYIEYYLLSLVLKSCWTMYIHLLLRHNIT